YALEDAWRRRLRKPADGAGSEAVWDDAAVLELDVALREQIRLTRADVAAEEAAYFDTFLSPSEMVNRVGTTFSDVMTQAQNVVGTRVAIQQAQPAPTRAGTEMTPEAFWAAHRADVDGAQLLELRKRLEHLQFEHDWRTGQ